MKVFVSVDMEGISGLVRWQDVSPNGTDMPSIDTFRIDAEGAFVPLGHAALPQDRGPRRAPRVRRQIACPTPSLDSHVPPDGRQRDKEIVLTEDETDLNGTLKFV